MTRQEKQHHQWTHQLTGNRLRLLQEALSRRRWPQIDPA
jgi:hypothetical protein